LFCHIFIFPWVWVVIRYQPAFIAIFGIAKGIFLTIKTLLCCCCRSNKVAPLAPEAAPNEITYEDAVKTSLLRGVKDYELSSNPLYSSAS
jgi:hypothetical protein